MSFHFRRYYRPQIISLVRWNRSVTQVILGEMGSWGRAEEGRQRNISFILLVLWRQLVRNIGKSCPWNFRWMVSWAIHSLWCPTYIVLLWIAYQVKLFQVVALCFYVYMCYTVPQKWIVMDFHYLVWNKGHYCLFWSLQKWHNHSCFFSSTYAGAATKYYFIINYSAHLFLNYLLIVSSNSLKSQFPKGHGDICSDQHSSSKSSLLRSWSQRPFGISVWKLTETINWLSNSCQLIFCRSINRVTLATLKICCSCYILAPTSNHQKVMAM